jgi:hypothetical protein
VAPRIALLVVFLLALGLYAATVQTAAFGDAAYLCDKVETGPTPYYNALYLPLGWAFHRLFGLVLGWGVFEGLGYFSALCGASAAVVLLLCLARIGCPLRWRVAWVLLLVLTPGVWFFSTTVEVHAIQLLGVSAAVGLCLIAREQSPGRALALVYAACATALLCQLSTVLVLPGLVFLARGARPGSGLSWKGLSWRAPVLINLALLVVIATVLLSYSRKPLEVSQSNPFDALVLFLDEYLTKIRNGRFYGPLEILDFLRAELWRPAALLLVLPLLRIFSGPRNRLFLPALVASLPYVLFLPQGGIREHGGYFLSLFPFFLLAGADAVAALLERRPSRAGLFAGVLALALVVQGWLGWQLLEEAGSRMDARSWARQVEAIVPQRSLVFTISQARRQFLKLGEKRIVAPIDLDREFETTPVDGLKREVNLWLGLASQNLKEGLRVFVDADFLDAPERPESHRRFEELLVRKPVRIEPLPPPPATPVLYELTPE